MISVIVPYYQTDKELFDACAESILHDINADIQLIIVDDGSGVKFHSICDEYLKDSRVRVFHLPHQGVSVARNYGIHVATGEWITFVDSDDKLEKDWYNKLNAHLNNSIYDIIIFNGYKNINGRLSKNIFFVKENVDYGADEVLKNKLMGSALSVGFFPRGYRNHYSLGSPCSKLYRNEFLKHNNLTFDPGVTFAEDTLFALNVYQQARHIVYIDLYLYHYVLNFRSVTNKFRPGLSNEMRFFFAKIKQFMDEHLLTNEYLSRAYYSRAYIELLRVMSLEFFNNKNPVSKAQRRKEFENFINYEPFKQALDNALCGKNGINHQILAILIKLRMYCFVNYLRFLKKSLRQRK